MIQLDNLRLRRGPDILLDQATITLHGGWKIGLTGRNGCGKSSLFALLTGQLEADAGSLSVPPDWRMAIMAQEVPALDQAAIDYVLDGNTPLRAAEKALRDAEASGDGMAIGHAHEKLDALNAWSLPARAAEVLAGLGFAADTQRNPVASFSGGWRMRLNLARVLLADADLLLLDEPTNHLDLDAVLWLQDWLQQAPQTLLLISHDRDFLDATISHILHIEQQRLTLYSGNYSAFERQRAERLAQQSHVYEKQKAQAEHLQKFIDRFRAQATKARQAQSRLKALARLELIAPAHAEDGFSFSFPKPLKLPNPMLDLVNVQCGYGDTSILREVTFSIRPETRLGLLGPNGAGKSTLIKTLATQLPALGGKFTVGPELVIGYFHQQQVDALPQDKTAFALMQLAQPKWEELQVRKELGRFGFHGDDAFAEVKRFSGGEKSRLALALLVQQKPALLLLDEPANHLDLDMREALTMALQEFEGAVVLVSHDRHLLETTVDELVLVANGTVSEWEGDLDDYARWLRERNKQASAVDSGSNGPSDNKLKRQQAAQKRANLRPLKQAADKLEKQLEKLQQQLAEVETRLGDETLYQADQKAALSDLLARQGTLRKQCESVESDWLDAMTALEEAEQADS
ncbi:MAG: ATP-binding cassette domain-containing protein [Alcanivoracaceae bacterium]|jgi:ATP-binding cassette subfamily F protein 3|nr:ATP-binding cassette domain-containing protein [Alcanivoracaceae bacterium]